MMNIRLQARHLLHNFNAKNRHGLHSPFVYRLVDEVIYDFSDKKVYQPIEAERKRLSHDQVSASSNIIKQAKLVQLLYRLLADHQPKTIIQTGNNEISALYANVLSPGTRFYTLQDYAAATGHADLIWISGGDITMQFEWCLPKVGEGTMMIINDIHLNSSSERSWVAIKANLQVTATIDLFWIGLVYFRKGQVKEDFRIRF